MEINKNNDFIEIILESYSDLSLQWGIIYLMWASIGTKIVIMAILAKRPYFFSSLLRYRIKEDEAGQYLLQQKYFIFWYNPDISSRDREDGEKNIRNKQRSGNQFSTKEKAITHIEIMKKDIRHSIGLDKKKRARPKRTVYETNLKDEFISKDR